MYRLSRLKYIFPIGLFVCLFLDGALSHVWAPLFFSYPYSMVSELVLLWLVLSYFFQDDIEIPLIPFAIAAGAVYDLYFSGILGLYIFLYPLVVEITKILSRYFSSSFLSMIMIFFVDIVIFETFNYWAYYLVNITNVSFGDYLIYTLAPTLALNLIYFVVLFWPIRAIYRWALDDDQI
ncbi:rod shape-determining protein MreD [Limosilactobacillus reuteri]|uniref:rod shape-determining protein MreD n=1 Tax=Limosilactobacillus reuteri TaxID=1598 RepID=UPI001E4A60D6|nr:rod shape-determining protein MreD [Limosilactobacillus reuteri]MCC4382652.1 rod shape-determining protein MreD [Limosilactobacillus reuteri]MCC4419427.1 rod shape-determining protein MreD [Limosilactobacillus reuteri]